MTFDDLLNDFQSLDRNFNSSIEENFTSLNMEISFDKLILPNIDLIKKLLKLISNADKLFNLSIEYNNFCPIMFEDYSSPEDFISNIKSSIEDNSIKDETYIKTDIKLKITKNINRGISIYSLKYFGSYLKEISLKEFFSNINKYNTNDFFIFYISDDSIQRKICSSSKFIFTGLNDTTSYQYIENNSTRNSFEANCITIGRKFVLTPKDYNLDTIISDDINNFFEKLKIIYSLMYISTSSELTNNNLNIKIHGYKSISLNLDLNTLDYSSLTIYYKIYNWIYNQDKNITDKLGIARNIISLYLTDHTENTDIYLNESILTSINASYSIYLKENVQNYLQVKSNIIDKISETNVKINDLINLITKNFIKNLASIGTFIISTLLINTIKSGKFSNIITPEMFLICMFLIIISCIYLYYTLKEYDFNKSRIKTLYSRLKESYQDLLIERDINALFKNDQYFNEDIEAADIKKKFYKNLWLFIIALVFILNIILLA